MSEEYSSMDHQVQLDCKLVMVFTIVRAYRESLYALDNSMGSNLDITHN